MFYTKITVNNRYANGHALVSKICRILHGVITSSGVNIGVGFPGYQHDKDRPEKSVLGSRVSLFGEANDILYLLEQPAIEKLKEKHMIMISTIDRVPENAEPIVFRRNQSFTIYSRLMKYLNKIIKQPDEYMGLDIEEIDNLINKGEPLRGKTNIRKLIGK